jgi:hypothetical protein
MRKEVVLVSQEEANYFEREETPRRSGPPSRQEVEEVKVGRGVYLAYTQFNDRQLDLYLVNATGFNLPYAIGEESGENFRGIAAGLLESQNYIKLKDMLVSEFDKWPSLVVQLLFHREGYYSLREPLVRKMKYKASTFFKSERKAPLLNKPAFLFQVDEGMAGGKPIDPDKLKERMYANTQEQDTANRITFSRPPARVDLHIEQLTNKYDSMNKNEMIELQLRAFEENLDKAIATGMEEITFIHGVGNGVLRDAIHRKLSKTDHIRYFEDAMKEKFGYGATLVRIK